MNLAASLVPRIPRPFSSASSVDKSQLARDSSLFKKVATLETTALESKLLFEAF